MPNNMNNASTTILIQFLPQFTIWQVVGGDKKKKVGLISTDKSCINYKIL